MLDEGGGLVHQTTLQGGGLGRLSDGRSDTEQQHDRAKDQLPYTGDWVHVRSFTEQGTASGGASAFGTRKAGDAGHRFGQYTRGRGHGVAWQARLPTHGLPAVQPATDGGGLLEQRAWGRLMENGWRPFALPARAETAHQEEALEWKTKADE